MTKTKLRVVILVGGYGTRLQRDIKASSDEEVLKLLGVPKALLPLGDRDALITHWVAILESAGVSIPDDVYIVSNAQMYPKFVEWAEIHNIPPEHICNDGTTSNETRLGAVADIEFAINQFKLEQGDLVVIGGDTLFLEDFDFKKLKEVFTKNDGCLVTTYEVDPMTTNKYGIAELEEPKADSTLPRIIKLHEKPEPHTVPSSVAVPCFYMLKQGSLPLITEFLNDCRARHAELSEYDATGKVLGYIVSRFAVYAASVKGRIDVGGLKSYQDAQEYFKNIAGKEIKIGQVDANESVVKGLITEEVKEKEPKDSMGKVDTNATVVGISGDKPKISNSGSICARLFGKNRGGKCIIS